MQRRKILKLLAHTTLATCATTIAHAFTLGRHRLAIERHTHGGQCQIPIINYAPILPSWGKNYREGHFEEKGRHLYVNRGIGTVDLKVRFSCPPELTLLELT